MKHEPEIRDGSCIITPSVLSGKMNHINLVCFAVMGCADYDAPRNTWVKRDGDNMEIGCVSTGEKWDMSCIEGEWAGEIGICPPGM